MEKRHFSRVVLESQVELNSGQEKWLGKLIDISLKGALIECPQGYSPAVSTQLHIKIQLPHLPQSIEFDGTICHIENNHLGIRCDKMDIHSISELRRIIELNLGSEEVLNRELHALAGSGVD